jgi:SP family sugar:H+ symporter-like MFS transporter
MFETVDPAFGRTLRLLAISVVAALGGFLFGFDSGVINGTIDALRAAFGSDDIGTGMNVASMLLGCAVGAFFAGTLADRFGRRPILLVAAVAFIASAWGSGIARHSAEFVSYRVLGGLAVGAASVLSPAYIAEVAPAAIRGRLVAIQQLAIVLGLFVAFLSNYLLAGLAGGAAAVFWGGFAAWQWMFWMEIVPATAFLVGLCLIPESPRYLVAAGREGKAEAIFAALSDKRTAVLEIAAIRETVHRDRKPRLVDVFDPVSRRLHSSVWIGLGLAVLVQFTGINVVFYYGAVLWQAAGFTEADALFTNVIGGCVNVVSTLVAMSLVDRIGRRPLLLGGALGQAATLGILAVVFSQSARTDEGTLQLSGTGGIIALLAANAYIACFACTWGAVYWVLVGEMFPNRIRGAALSLAGAACWLATFLVTITFPAMLDRLGLGVSYGIYASFGVVAYWFVRTFVRETRGQTLEQISLDRG